MTFFMRKAHLPLNRGLIYSLKERKGESFEFFIVFLAYLNRKLWTATIGWISLQPK
jgi:hypothetical protein